MEPGSNPISDIETFKKLIKDIRFAMLTTIDVESGDLKSRPMTLQAAEFAGDLWFIVGKSTAASQDVQNNARVNLAFADPKNVDFVSVCGDGEILVDRAKIDELWNPVYKAWFSGGKEDPDVALLKVRVSSADWWQAPSSKLVRLIGFAKAAVTSQGDSKLGERYHLDLH